MESPVLDEKPFRWDRDGIMRALNSSYVKTEEFSAEVEVALAASDTHAEWERLIEQDPCADEKWTRLNKVVGIVAKRHFEIQKDSDVRT